MARTATWLEALLNREGWSVRVARACGACPRVGLAELSVPLDGDLPRPLRMAFASDFHAGRTSDAGVLREACALLRDAQPDVLLLGGDYITSAAKEVDWLVAELATVPAAYGRYAILGNHDWWCDAAYVTQRLEASGIQVLTNRNVRLAEPFTDVWICGLDDHGAGQPEAQGALRGAQGIRVVLMHSPSGLLDLGDERFEIALAGHTHGGQIALPGGRPIVVPEGRLSRRYSRGRFDVGNGRTLFVSVGIGCVVVPVRLHAEPEIVVCELRSRGGMVGAGGLSQEPRPTPRGEAPGRAPSGPGPEARIP